MKEYINCFLVFGSGRYVEFRMYLCRSFNRENSLSREELYLTNKIYCKCFREAH